MKILITGAAGFVGQNLMTLLDKKNDIIAVDRNVKNLKLLKKLHPKVKTVNADLSKSGDWQNNFKGIDVVITLHAQIASKTSEAFYKSNVNALKNILKAMKKYKVPYIVHVSSSVVESVARDDYTLSKKKSEELVKESGIRYVTLRPTLMYGCFDYKHIGWIIRFMEKTPVFPIPGNGKFIRQPLYVMDFCRIIVSCLEKKPKNKTYDITGKEKIYYIDMMKKIAKTKGIKRIFLKIPIPLFSFLLDFYGIFTKKPIFTSDQLRALIAGDEFKVIKWWDIFGVKYTPFEKGIEKMFKSSYYRYVLEKAY